MCSPEVCPYLSAFFPVTSHVCARVALPHEECYPIGFVASPEMLPVRAHATMMPSTTGRHHETRNDARSSRGIGGCDPKSLFGSRGKRQGQDIARVHSGDG